MKSIEDITKEAELQAVKDGYDQVIIKNRNGDYSFRRVTKSYKIRQKKKVCYIRLFYKDGVLEPRSCPV
ncbi:MAG: hypothetical protein IKW90_02450 [Lachnospiraceae bacterium]|nr:hypothetical protein [Lachnospiraceae bacterium]